MMSPKRFFASITASALLGGVIASGVHYVFSNTRPDKLIYEPAQVQQPIRLTGLTNDNKTASPNLVNAAQVATPAVVHIKATYEAKATKVQRRNNPLDEFLKEFFGRDFPIGPQEQKSKPQQTAGSGVIIGADGYIVTNNHVIDGADQIEVTLDDNRRYTAKLIGQDPNTDLALLKIEEKKLPHLLFGNSDTLQVGEWVLAVGNPFNLTSTVTKGIVSAKARNINILQNKSGMSIEAFIQTDAAVNSGNSGGALVNLKGELVGINTAISAPTGTFAGYAFAIPSSLVKKITDDLKKYGTVQRGMLGVVIRGVDADLAKEKGLKQLSGVYVSEVTKEGAAVKAGLKKGDVIVAINGNKVRSASELQEQVARYKPNDKLRVTFYRKNKEKTVTVVLKRQETENMLAGATFENLKQVIEGPNGVQGRVHIKTLKEGPWKQAGIKAGFIITAIDNELITQAGQLKGILDGKKKAFLVDGFYPGGQAASYAVAWGQQ